MKPAGASTFGRELDTSIGQHNNLFAPIVAIGKTKRGGERLHALTFVRHRGGEVGQAGDFDRHVRCRFRYHQTGIGMSAEDRWTHGFRSLHDGGHVCLKIAHPLTDARKVRCD